MADIDLSKTLTGIRGETLMENGAPLSMTLADACVAALVKAPAQPIGYQKSVERFRLAKRLCENPVGPITTEERMTIKDALAEMYGPLFIGQIEAALEA